MNLDEFEHLTPWLKKRLQKALDAKDYHRARRTLDFWLGLKKFLRALLSLFITKKQKDRHQLQYLDVEKCKEQITSIVQRNKYALNETESTLPSNTPEEPKLPEKKQQKASTTATMSTTTTEVSVKHPKDDAASVSPTNNKGIDEQNKPDDSEHATAVKDCENAHPKRYHTEQTEENDNNADAPSNQKSVILGEGGFAVVKLKGNDAHKKMNDKKIYENEVEALKACQGHPNIAQLLRVKENHRHSKYTIIMEAGVINLADWVKPDTRNKKFNPLPDQEYERQLNTFFIAIASAIKFVHDKSFIHRDIKAPNVVITANNVAKLIDFGIACKKAEFQTKLEGSYQYLPPENFISDKDKLPPGITGEKLDVYAFGLLMLESITGKKLYKGFSNFINLIMLRQGELEKQDESGPELLLKEISDEKPIKALIRHCIHKQHNTRYDDQQMLDGVKKLNP